MSFNQIVTSLVLVLVLVVFQNIPATAEDVDLDRNLCQNVTYAIESKCLDAVESQNYTIRFARWPNAKGRCKKMSRQLTRFTSRPTSSINATIYMQKCKKHTREIKGSLNIAALKWVCRGNSAITQNLVRVIYQPDPLEDLCSLPGKDEDATTCTTVLPTPPPCFC
ncbi:uncharacterized protein [Dysidea avara]|uniref:uncharacterized protein n=1 Tax=Dysidea avara TaxID=196820 RepID=UPI003326B57A